MELYNLVGDVDALAVGEKVVRIREYLAPSELPCLSMEEGQSQWRSQL